MFSSGMNAATARRNSETASKAGDRQDRQQKLTAAMANFDYDEEQQIYVPNEIKAGQDANKVSEIALMKEQLDAQTKALKAQQSKFNADGITDILVGISSGNWRDAHKAWRTTPGLKETLSKSPSLNVSDIGPINFSDPLDMDMLKDIKGFNQARIDEPGYTDAVQKTLMKVQGNDGTWRLMPVDQVVKSTNTMNMMSTQQRDTYSSNARSVNAILANTSPAANDLVDDKVNVMATAVATRDASEVMKAFQLTNPEEFAKATSGTTRRDELQQYTDALLMSKPDITGTELQSAMSTWVLKKQQGTKAVKELSDVTKVVETATTDPATPPVNPVRVEQETMTALQQTNKKEYDRVQEDITSMKDNFNLANNLDKVLKGTGKKIDKDVVASVKDKISKWFGYENEQVLTNAMFDTQSGMLLADYILSRSGTAASDRERDFLTNLMTSASFDDEVYVRNAMQTFSTALKEKNKTLSGPVGKFAPDSAATYNKFKPTRAEMLKFLRDN